MISYKDSGVDIDAGNSLVEAIKPLVKSTFDSNVIGGIGGFAGAYAIPTGYKEPVLLSATDGVGTKLRLAIDNQKYSGMGIDLVAMCVNDLLCSFATPMFFLDYYATAKLDVPIAKEVIAGIAQGCQQSECALIGGETAEMPGMYAKDDFDLAGFCVGVAEREDLTRNRVKAGDILVALPSSGVHSNGFSLVRKVIETHNLDPDMEVGHKRLMSTLLEPTRIYVKTFKQLKDKISALAHITGGGIVENLPRVLPENLKAVVAKEKIQTLPIFDLLSQYVEESEMYRTFNMGVGMVLVVDSQDINDVLGNSDGYIIGHIEEGNKGVELL